MANGTADKGSVFVSLLREELGTLLPAVVVHNSTDSIFECLARSDPAASPLLEHSLAMLHTDLNVPATEACTQKVRAYLRSMASEVDAEDLTLTDAELAFCQPLLGGFSEDMVKQLLPRLLRTHKANRDGALNDVFSRVSLSHPPAITKAQLLAYLHRLDVESAGLTRKSSRTSLAFVLTGATFVGTLYEMRCCTFCKTLYRAAF